MIRIDWRAVWLLAEHKRKSEGISFRQLSAKLGINKGGSSFTRLKAGMAVDAETLVTVLDWLGCSYRSFLKPRKGAA